MDIVCLHCTALSRETAATEGAAAESEAANGRRDAIVRTFVECFSL